MPTIEEVVLLLSARDASQAAWRSFARNMADGERGSKAVAAAMATQSRAARELDSAQNAVNLRTGATAVAQARAADAATGATNAVAAQRRATVAQTAALDRFTTAQTASTAATADAAIVQGKLTAARAASAQAVADEAAAVSGSQQAVALALATRTAAQAKLTAAEDAYNAAVARGAGTRSIGAFRGQVTRAQAGLTSADSGALATAQAQAGAVAAARATTIAAAKEATEAEALNTAAIKASTKAAREQALALKGSEDAEYRVATATTTASRAATEAAAVAERLAAAQETQRLGALRLADAQGAVAAANEGAALAGKATGVAGMLSAAAPSLAAGAALAAGVLSFEAIKRSLDVTHQIAQVGSATGADTTGLRSNLGDYAASGAAPYDLSTLVKGTYLPYSEGMTTRQVAALTPILAKTSAVLGLPNEDDASKAILTLANVYGKGAQTSTKGFEYFANLLLGTERTVRLPAGDIARALPRSVGVAAVTGVSAPDYLAYIAKQSYSGQTAIQANNNLSATLTALLLKPTAATKSLAVAAGVPIQQAGEAFIRQNGLQSYLQLIDRRFAGDEQDLSQFLGQRNALRGFLYNKAGAGYAQIADITGKITNAEGTDLLPSAYAARQKADPLLNFATVSSRFSADLAGMGDAINTQAIPALLKLADSALAGTEGLGHALGQGGNFLDQTIKPLSDTLNAENDALSQFGKDHTLRPTADAIGAAGDALLAKINSYVPSWLGGGSPPIAAPPPPPAVSPNARSTQWVAANAAQAHIDAGNQLASGRYTAIGTSDYPGETGSAVIDTQTGLQYASLAAAKAASTASGLPRTRPGQVSFAPADQRLSTEDAAARDRLARRAAIPGLNKDATDQRRTLQAMIDSGTASDKQFADALAVYSRELTASGFAPGSKASMLAQATKNVRSFTGTRALTADQAGIDSARIFGEGVAGKGGSPAEQNLALQKQYYAATKYISDGLKYGKLSKDQATDLTQQRNLSNKQGLGKIAQDELGRQEDHLQALVASHAGQSVITSAVTAAIAYASANAGKLGLSSDQLVSFSANLKQTYGAALRAATGPTLIRPASPGGFVDATFGTSLAQLVGAGAAGDEQVGVLRALLAQAQAQIGSLNQQVAYLRASSTSLAHIDANTRPKDAPKPARGNPHSGLRPSV